VGGVTTYYVGAHYQVDNGVVTKYYFAGAQRVAMRKNGTLSYLLADHLGSTSLTTNTSGALVSELRYKAWGETRYSSGTTPTSYRYTGQREEAGIGLYFYNARWYDPLIGRFTSADTIVPEQSQGGQAWDRYAYVNNNPIRFNDPTGHRCAPDDECTGGQTHSYLRTTAYWKAHIKNQFGITMSDEGGKEWDLRNLTLISSSLQNIDDALNGQLKSWVGGAIFWLKKQNSGGQYRGVTHLDGSGIDFYTLGNDAIRQINIYHEVGHLIDNVPGLKDVFTNSVEDENPSWVSNDYISQGALEEYRISNDPNYNSPGPQAIQAYNPGPAEQWADAFANYVAGNINLASSEGRDMYNFVHDLLIPD
jgi:RHS repeat-associated protein